MSGSPDIRRLLEDHAVLTEGGVPMRVALALHRGRQVPSPINGGKIKKKRTGSAAGGRAWPAWRERRTNEGPSWRTGHGVPPEKGHAARDPEGGMCVDVSQHRSRKAHRVRSGRGESADFCQLFDQSSAVQNAVIAEISRGGRAS